MDIFKNLNNEQVEGVKHIESPLLIIAGAGSGKTRVITHKIAYLVMEKGIMPYNILGITFTNKAANEMKARVVSLTEMEPNLFNISTFHSLGLKILKANADKFGYDKTWTVMDKDDEKKVVKKISRDLYEDISNEDIKDYMRMIDNLKMNLLYPNNFEDLYELGYDEKFLEVYKRYFEYQKRNHLWDFEDLISLSVKMLETDEDLKKYYSNRFKYVVVDEFQDTNPNQYELMKLIAKSHQNITIVGDEDQAIYGWRGANSKFLFDFKHDFPNTKIIKLEQNYRSTPQILDFSNEIIKKKNQEFVKMLWTDKKGGSPVIVYNSYSKFDEANDMANLIKRLNTNDKDIFPIAILYRINSQSRIIEKELSSNGIPYKIIKGLRFFERKEVKDSIALVSLAANLNDNLSFIRVCDFASIGIGDRTIKELENHIDSDNPSLFKIYKKIYPKKFNSRSFFKTIEKLNKEFDNLRFSEVLKEILKEIDYLEKFEIKQEFSRISNINELIDYFDEWQKENSNKSFFDLKESITLDSDNKDKNTKYYPVLLSTIHNAKGLEFPTVIILSVNDFYLPFIRRTGREEIEEEKRLFYVGCTRAMNYLVVSTGHYEASRFIKNINRSKYRVVDDWISLIDIINKSKTEESRLISNSNNNKIEFVNHPIFGKGEVLSKVSKSKFLIKFENDKEIVIDTDIINLEFL